MFFKKCLRLFFWCYPKVKRKGKDVTGLAQGPAAKKAKHELKIRQQCDPDEMLHARVVYYMRCMKTAFNSRKKSTEVKKGEEIRFDAVLNSIMLNQEIFGPSQAAIFEKVSNFRKTKKSDIDIELLRAGEPEHVPLHQQDARFLKVHESRASRRLATNLTAGGKDSSEPNVTSTSSSTVRKTEDQVQGANRNTTVKDEILLWDRITNGVYGKVSTEKFYEVCFWPDVMQQEFAVRRKTLQKILEFSDRKITMKDQWRDVLDTLKQQSEKTTDGLKQCESTKQTIVGMGLPEALLVLLENFFSAHYKITAMSNKMSNVKLGSLPETIRSVSATSMIALPEGQNFAKAQFHLDKYFILDI